MKSLMKQLSFILSFLLLISSFAFAGELVEKFDKSFTLKPGQKFYLKNKNGAVRVYGWDKKEVRVEALKRVKADSRQQAEQIMQEIEIQVNEEDDVLRIETFTPKFSSSGFLSWLFDGLSSRSIEVKYTIWLPADVDGEIRTVNGSIQAKDIKGKVQLKSTNGRIRVENAAGVVKAATTNGSISIELLKVDSDANIRIRTTNGSVKLYLPDSFAGRLDARTTNGSISTDFPIEVSGRFNRHSLHGTIGNGTASCDIATTNGYIKILKIE